ncbi:MAG: long-chain-fatty-acid--CoA ligase [Cyanobacteria bacterium]|nr:long-chain-fatty-acid--CoA ligase [Cyanobacteriota bacterium]
MSISAGSIEKKNESLFEAIESQSRSNPDRTALIYEDEETSYAQLYARSAAIAEQLAGLGVSKADRVALLFPNHPEFVAAFFAVVGLGAVVVPVNPQLKSEEIAHILSDSQAKVLVVDEAGLSEALGALRPAADARASMPSLENILVSKPNAASDESEDESTVYGVTIKGLTPMRASRHSVKFEENIDAANDLALIVYTSGTTGKPKGAMLTHRNISTALKESLFESFEISTADRFLGVLPLCHIYGIGVLVYSNVVRGTSLVILNKFDAKKVLQIIEKHRVTLLPLVPTMYQFLVMEMQETKVDLSSLRFCICAAAPLPKELHEQIEAELGVTVIEGYGLSETACGGTVNPPAKTKIGSIGKPISCLDMAIRAEDGSFLPAGPDKIGEIAIRGNNVMIGYHGKPEATAEAFADGWFLTGDLGYRDEEGYYYIAGRKKELIIRGGANIYPREVEEAILRMPEVQDVAVIGVPDKLMGERVKAVVVLRKEATLSEEQVKEFCNQHLAQYKVPRIVEFRTELPRNSTGKILKRNL